MSTNFLTVSQTAEKLSITRQAVQYLIENKRLQAFWMLERWAIPATEVAKYRRKRIKKSNGHKT